MAITIISSETKIAAGNITIPVNCDRIYAFVVGSVEPPKIGGVSMATVLKVDKSDRTKAISIHQYIPVETNVQKAVIITGESVVFVYLADAESVRQGTISGRAITTLSGDLSTSVNDLVFGFLVGEIGLTTIKGDAVAFTYLVNETTSKLGYIVPPDTVLSCVAEDSGISAGYWKDGGVIHHDRELVSEGYYSFDPVLHTVVWRYHYTKSPGVEIYGKYDNGVFTGDLLTLYLPGTVPAPKTYYVYVQTWHDAVYIEAYDEELPDIWVPGGEHAQVAVAFVSIQIDPRGQMTGRSIFFG